MSLNEKKRVEASFLSSWLWWVVAIVSLTAAVGVVLISAVGFEGYFGTTGIRRATSAEFNAKFASGLTQDDIVQLREPDSGSTSEKPVVYLSKADIIERQNGLYKLDRRLARLFNLYLANRDVIDPSIKPVAHDFIEIRTTDSRYSSLSMPPDNQPSVSTLYRGVGVRVTGLDKIKCSYMRPCDGPTCNMTCPKEWTKFKQYPVLFTPDDIDTVATNATADFATIPGCLTQCAVDYYPYVDSKIIDSSQNSKRQPAETTLDQFRSLASSASDYKLAALANELLYTDDQVGTKPAYQGSAKLTPFSIIVPENIKTLLEKQGDWTRLLSHADSAYFLPLQKRSSLAGLWFDQYLNGKEGSDRSIHINY